MWQDAKHNFLVTTDIKNLSRQLLHSLKETDEVRVPYKPLIRAVRSKSRGFVHRPLSVTTGRLMHLLSEGEYHAFHFLDIASPPFRNLREGFGLPIELTQAIATELGIKHPFDRFAGADAQMSVDFVCTEPDGSWTAYDYKPSADAPKKRVRQKFKIAHRAFELVGVPHRILTEADLNATVIRNLLFLRPLVLPQEKIYFPQNELQQIANLLKPLLAEGRTIFQAAQRLSCELEHSAARLCRTALWLIIHRYLPVDLEHTVDPDLPVHFL